MNNYVGGNGFAKSGSIPGGGQPLSGRGVAPPQQVRFLPASTPYGSHPVGPTSPTTGPGGFQLSEGELYAFIETMDGRFPSDDMEYIEA